MASNLITTGASTTEIVASGASSATFTTTLVDGAVYSLVATVAAWFAVAASPTAAAHTTGSMYLPAGVPRLFLAPAGSFKVAVIQDSAGGFVELTKCQ